MERDALTKDQMLVISIRASTVTRTTRATALARNQFVLTLAPERVVPFAAHGSPQVSLVAEFTTDQGVH